MLRSKILKGILWVLFAAYIALVLKLTVFRNQAAPIRSITVYPTIMLINIYKNIGLEYFSYMFFGNIGWFMPFGFILPLLIKKIDVKKILLLTFLFSLFIEASQYMLMVGYTEIDDLILNTLGGLLGYLTLTKRKVFINSFNSNHSVKADLFKRLLA